MANRFDAITLLLLLPAVQACVASWKGVIVKVHRRWKVIRESRGAVASRGFFVGQVAVASAGVVQVRRVVNEVVRARFVNLELTGCY